MNIIDQLHEWDGIHMDFLKGIYNNNSTNPIFFINLVDLLTTHVDLQTPSTWLIKHHYDQNGELAKPLIKKLLQKANKLEFWEAQLHLLQILPKVEIPEIALIPVDDLVKVGLKSKNKFVRAWAFQGYYELTKSIPEYTDELILLCNDALQIESPSVKVRINKILQVLQV